MKDNNNEIYNTMHEITNYDIYEKNDIEIQKKRDAFLDSYSAYLEDKSFLPKSILKRRIIELELIDPSFDFEIDD